MRPESGGADAPAPPRSLSIRQPIRPPIISGRMEKRQKRPEPAPPQPHNDNAAAERKPEPDALARDDLPEAERIEQQNDLA